MTEAFEVLPVAVPQAISYFWPMISSTGVAIVALMKLFIDGQKIRVSDSNLKLSKLKIQKLEQELKANDGNIILPTAEEIKQHGVSSDDPIPMSEKFVLAALALIVALPLAKVAWDVSNAPTERHLIANQPTFEEILPDPTLPLDRAPEGKV